MRSTALWSLLLALACAGAAHAQAGMVASGTVKLTGPQGAESGTITVSAWGEQYCKITVQLGAPQDHRSYTATLNVRRVSIRAPQGLAGAAPLPISPAIGCALLPQALAYDRIRQGSATLQSDQLGRPVSLSWTRGGQTFALSYQNYQSSAGITYAAALAETVAGQIRLTIQLTSVTSQNFSNSDFPVPPLQAPPTHGFPASAGGGQ